MSIRQAYNSWANIYDSNENKTRDLDKVATQKILSEFNFETVIELGCGTGKNTEWLLTKAQSIIGLDFSEEMLEKAKAKIQSDKVNFLQADLKEPWKIPNDFADLITVNLVLEHLENLDFIFQEAHLKLKEKGLFFICELHPFKQYSGSLAQFENENGELENLEVYWHHLSDYTECAAENGFQLLKVNEWFDEQDKAKIPRLISFVFEKNSYSNENTLPI